MHTSDGVSFLPHLMQLTLIIIAAVTLGLLGASVWLSRLGRDGSELADGTVPKPPPAAPWERDGGEDLSTPVAVVEAPPVTTSAPPAGARYRSTETEPAPANSAIVEEVARGLEKIPPLPRALHLILRELNDVGSTAKSVAGIVSTEQVLSAALLRVVNSAASGLRREILTVDQAVAYLGFSTVRSLVVRLQMGIIMPSRGATGGAYDPEKLWVHSVAVSQVAEHLAARVKNVDPWLCSTIGLLHDIGKLAVNSQFLQQVKKLWERSERADESFLARERRLFGADHAFLGAYVTSRWQLPTELTEAIRLHHLPTDQSHDMLRPDVLRALRVAHVANQLVKYSHCYCEDMEIDIVYPEMLQAIGLPPTLEELLDAKVKAVIERATRLGSAASNDGGNDRGRRVA
jgi:putative nucleotidyltransferase with HDIG domain